MQLFFGSFFVLGFVLLLTPFAPLLAYAIFPPNIGIMQLPEVQRPQGSTTEQTDRIVIPKIGVDIPIYEGGEEMLDRGAWLLPMTSNSPSNGNMVVSAHRFRYRPPAKTTFYLLDKLEANDEIYLYWKDSVYQYRVTDRAIVEATALSILEPTKQPTLTLLTCHPLFSTAQRLVVTARPQ